MANGSNNLCLEKKVNVTDDGGEVSNDGGLGSATVGCMTTSEDSKNFTEKLSKLKYKMTITGKPNKLKDGDDVRAWICNMEHLCHFYEFNDLESRTFIYSNVKNNTRKKHVANIMKDNPSCPLPELLTALSIGLGAKTSGFIVAENYSMRRKKGETVANFGQRVHDVARCKVATDPNGEALLKSEIFQFDTLNLFFRGLRSRKFVEECCEREVKTIEEAIIVITLFTTNQLRLANFSTTKQGFHRRLIVESS